MTKLKYLLIGILSIIILGLVGISYLSYKHRAPVFSDETKAAMDYVQNQLIDARGLLETYPYRASKIPFNPKYVREALSESIGVWMHILEVLNRKEEFAHQVEILKNDFLLPNGTLSWRIEILKGEEIKPDSYSAPIDDLRIIHSLLKASKRWHVPEYQNFALKLARAIEKNAVYQDHLLNIPFIEGEREPYVVDLSYLDLETMFMLSKLDPDWKRIYDKSMTLLLGGRRENGFFYDNYDVEKKQYFDKEKNLINQIICAIYLEERGVGAEKFLSMLQSKWRSDGRLFGRYDPATGSPLVNYESVAVYALAYRLAMMSGYYDFARQLEKRMTQMRMVPKSRFWEGALCENGGHSFDHLLTLLDQVLYKTNEKK
ncbi:MAG: hypothetical protein HZC17_05125 [Candidatus Omnitrophica bacterium]|nr:hypothetical protein [Candidatus Omnitrophota bacterium]